MKRGRKPKPRALRVYEGNPSRRRLPDAPEPPSPPAPPDPPEHLDGEALRFWRSYAPPLHALGLLSAADVAALSLAAAAWSDYRAASEQIRRLGAVLTGKKGMQYQSPYVAIRHRAEERLRHWLAEFGLTPSSRMRLRVAPAPADEIEAALSLTTGAPT